MDQRANFVYTRLEESDALVVKIFNEYLPLIQEDSDSRELFKSSVNHSNMNLVSVLIERFPNLPQDDQLLRDCDPPKILIAIKNFHEKFQHQDIRKYVIQGFQSAVQD